MGLFDRVRDPATPDREAVDRSVGAAGGQPADRTGQSPDPPGRRPEDTGPDADARPDPDPSPT